MKKPLRGRVCVVPVLKTQQYKVQLNCADEYNIPLNIWTKYLPERQKCLDYHVDLQYCHGKFHFEVGIGQKKPTTFYVPEEELNMTNHLNMEG